MQHPNRIWILLLAAAALVLPAGAASGSSVELYGGRYMPDDTTFDDETTYGFRVGSQVSDRIGFEASVGRLDFSQANAGFGLDFEATFVDLSAQGTVNPGGPVEWILFAGPGYAFADLELTSPGGNLGSASDDTFTAHLGTALRVSLGERLYLRPDVRARWFESSEDLDVEASLAVGLTFGGR